MLISDNRQKEKDGGKWEKGAEKNQIV